MLLALLIRTRHVGHASCSIRSDPHRIPTNTCTPRASGVHSLRRSLRNARAFAPKRPQLWWTKVLPHPRFAQSLSSWSPPNRRTPPRTRTEIAPKSWALREEFLFCGATLPLCGSHAAAAAVQGRGGAQSQSKRLRKRPLGCRCSVPAAWRCSHVGTGLHSMTLHRQQQQRH
jgi:hypothetical protein